MNIKKIAELAQPHKEVPAVSALLSNLAFANIKMQSASESLGYYCEALKNIISGDWGPSLDTYHAGTVAGAIAGEQLAFHSACALAIVLKSLGVKDPALDF